MGVPPAGWVSAIGCLAAAFLGYGAMAAALWGLMLVFVLVAAYAETSPGP